jgi:hypothetical protein
MNLNLLRLLMGDAVSFQIWKLRVRLRSSEAKELRKKLEDELALYLQRIIASARSRGVKPYSSEASRLYEMDDFMQVMDKSGEEGGYLS